MLRMLQCCGEWSSDSRGVVPSYCKPQAYVHAKYVASSMNLDHVFWIEPDFTLRGQGEEWNMVIEYGD